MLIITGAVVTISISSLNTKNLTNLYTDLKSLNDKISVYYNSYGELPVKEKFTGSYDFVIDANPNDDADLYYVIDASKLNNLILAKNISWSGDDVYIINEKTHMIYYPKGISLDGEMYYRLPGEYSKIEDTTLDKSDIAENADDFYGDYVINYTTPSGDPNVRWRIFHADEENIYLIADDYIHFDYAPQSTNYTLYKNDTAYKLDFRTVYQDYSGSDNIIDPRITKWLSYVSDNPDSTNTNIKAVAFMLDTTIWNSKYANSIYAEYAVGGPTLDLFCASYKRTHTDKYIEYEYGSTGYAIRWNGSGSYDSNALEGLNESESLYVISDVNKAQGMWIASPMGMTASYLPVVNGEFISGVGYNSSFYFNNLYPGLRPIICLKSGIQLEKISDTELKIIEQ